MGFRSVAQALVLGACLTGCAIIAGLQGERGPDDAGPVDELPPRVDAAGVPGEDAACSASVAPLGGDGIVRAKRAAAAPEIDGIFDEWACVDRVELGSGAYSNGLPQGLHAVEFAFQWTPTALYFYAKATTVAPGGGSTGNQIFRNDSVHLVIGPKPIAGDGTYRASDHQVTFDVNDRSGDYRGGAFQAASKIDARVVQKTSGAELTFEIEARFATAFFGLGELSASTPFGVNLQLIDAKSNDAGSDYGYRVWRLPPACVCRTGCCLPDGVRSSPTCDIRCTETLQLE